jgi:hypothetical protein
VASVCGLQFLLVCSHANGYGFQAASIECGRHPKCATSMVRTRAPVGDEPGLDLGLTIVAELSQAMGGAFGVASVPGVGSTFSVRLPHVVEMRR